MSMTARVRWPMCDVALSCLYWAVSGTAIGLAGATAYVALRSVVYTVVAQPTVGMAGAMAALTMYFMFAAVVAVIAVFPLAFAITYAYTIAARAGLFDDRSRRQLFLTALSVGGVGTALFVWATGMERADVSPEAVVVLLGLWMAIATGWAGPRLLIRQLHPGRFSRVDVSA